MPDEFDPSRDGEMPEAGATVEFEEPDEPEVVAHSAGTDAEDLPWCVGYWPA